jgi:hypothetical protein
MYPYIGVFTVDGNFAGLFGRLARSPLIDLKAREVAVLVKQAFLIVSQSNARHVVVPYLGS